ncbi:MAG: response regulator [Gemmatimonadetes bacterium]|nr:response regulator [Gemmatimonadota bacterium]
MHKLLARQLRRHFGSTEAVPPELASLIDAIEAAYRQADDDRAMLEHSMEMVSFELADRLHRLHGAIGQRDETAQALSLLSATLESTADGMLVVDLGGILVRTNSRLVTHWNLPQRLLDARDGRGVLSFVADQLNEREGFLQRTRDLDAQPEREHTETVSCADGRVFEVHSVPHRMGDRAQGRVWTFRDVTARRALEEQLRQSQKMEAIGQLAGGVAHDFNNLLTVIRAHAEILSTQLAETLPLQDSVGQIGRAADRAAELTRQLLAFSRKQVMQAKVFDVADAVREVEPMLRRLIGEDIEVAVSSEDRGTLVFADPGQLEQVLVNLAINARDAMPNGGRLMIDVTPVTVTGAPGRETPKRMPEGRYVLLQVADTGTGMPREVLDKVFEPFFTTKEPGRGTGLGLSMVYGIVKQSNGYIWAESAPGQGTTFRVYLPQAEGAAVAALGLGEGAPSRAPRGTETLLVAEDEESLLGLVRDLLQAEGYSVLTAKNGLEAIALESRHRGRIDALVTDVIMPGMGGRELSERIRKARPGIRVLYVSGYANNELDLPGSDLNCAFLAKPFTGRVLAAAIRELLDRRNPDAGAAAVRRSGGLRLA